VEPVGDPAAALAGSGMPFEGACAIYFALDNDVQGVLVLGETISGEVLEDEDAQMLRAQVGTLLGYVQGARHLATITALNADLTRQNEELTRTVTELTEARQTIDLLERAGERVRSFLRAEGQRSRRFSWLDCGIILVAAVLLGFLFNLASPNGVPLVPEHLRRPPAQTVTAQKARELQQSEGALIVDARPQAFFDQQRVRGAVNLTPALFDMMYLMRFAQVPLSTPLIVYGGSISRRWDEDVAAKLVAREHERVLVLEEGLPAWTARGYPVEP
jgi:rhodanese-related sulfurtransferase